MLFNLSIPKTCVTTSTEIPLIFIAFKSLDFFRIMYLVIAVHYLIPAKTIQFWPYCGVIPFRVRSNINNSRSCVIECEQNL